MITLTGLLMVTILSDCVFVVFWLLTVMPLGMHWIWMSSTLVSAIICKFWFRLSFYRAMLCIRGTSHEPVPVHRVCPCPSVTSRCSTKTARRRITQTRPHDTPGTLVFCYKDLRKIRPGSPPTGAPNAGGVGQNRRLSTNNRLYLENGDR